MTAAPGTELGDLVARALREWGRSDHVRAILVKGSAGPTGVVPAGGDLDLLIVTDSRPGDDWFKELRIDGVAVEMFVRSEESLTDADEILRHQSLPFELVENLHLADAHAILARVREAVRPRLLEPEFVLARARASQQGAHESADQAGALLAEGRIEEAARTLTIALWHGAAAAASAVGSKPTTRRCLVVWAQAIERIGVPGQLELLAESVGPERDAADLARLADRLGAGDDRVAAGVGAMVAAGETHWAAFSILRSALWQPMSARHAQEAREAVLAHLAWGADGLPQRVGAAMRLVRGLEDLIGQGVDPADRP